MSKIIETKLNKFNGGITNDPRDVRTNVARVISNFDVLTSPKRAIPYRQSESGDSAASSRKKQAFAVALSTGTTYSLYGLGVVSNQSNGAVEYMGLADLTGNTWTASGASTDPLYVMKFDCWVYYQKVGIIFGFNHYNGGGLRIAGLTTSSDTWADDVASLGTLANTDANSVVAQGIVHSKDNYLYLPYDNKIAVKALGTSGVDNWTTVALTLPTHFVIASICEYGNYIAILCTNKNGTGNSRVFLWNRDESVTTLSESIDAGSGSGMIIEEVDGELIVIFQKGGISPAVAFPTNSSVLNIPNPTTAHRDRVIFRRLIGNRFVKDFELLVDRTGGTNTTTVMRYKQKIDSRMYFQMIAQLNGAVRDGVWSFGRSSPDEPFTLVHERTSNNSTALTTGDGVKGFISVGDFLFQSYTSSSTFALSKTIEVADTAFSAKSIIETKKYDGSEHLFDSSFYKNLKEVAVTTDAMVTNGQIVLQYRINALETTSWTTLFTNTTDASLSHTATNNESADSALPTDYKEIEFRVEATGGAEVTAIAFKEEVTERKAIAD